MGAEVALWEGGFRQRSVEGGVVIVRGVEKGMIDCGGLDWRGEGFGK